MPRQNRLVLKMQTIVACSASMESTRDPKKIGFFALLGVERRGTSWAHFCSEYRTGAGTYACVLWKLCYRPLPLTDCSDGPGLRETRGSVRRELRWAFTTDTRFGFESCMKRESNLKRVSGLFSMTGQLASIQTDFHMKIGLILTGRELMKSYFRSSVGLTLWVSKSCLTQFMANPN